MKRSIWGLSLFIAVIAVVLGSGELVRADPYRGRVDSFRSVMELSGQLYTYVPAVRSRRSRRARRARGSWAVKQLRSLLGRGRTSAAFAIKVPSSRMPGAENPGTRDRGLDAIDAAGAVFMAMASGGTGIEDGEGGEGAAGPEEPGELGLTEMNAAVIEAAIASLPAFAVDVAGAMTQFSDGAVDLVAGLSSVLSSVGLDWGKIFRNREELQSDRQKDAEKEKRRRAKQEDAGVLAKDRMRREMERIQVRKVVKSVFKILIGLGLGVGFWLVVRRSL